MYINEQLERMQISATDTQVGNTIVT